MVCRVFIFLSLVLRNMNTPTNHEQLSKQEAEIWTLLQTMNSSQNKRAGIWTLLQTMNSSQNKREKYEHSYKPWTALKARDIYEHSYNPWTALKTRGRNMNTPTKHEQLSKQEAVIWTLLQTTNSSQNKRQKYEHSYKAWTALKTRGRNMNTPTNHEQLSKQEGSWNMKCSYTLLFWPELSKQEGRNMNTPTNCSWTALKTRGSEIWTLLQTMNSSQNKRAEIWTLLMNSLKTSRSEIWTLLQPMNSSQNKRAVHWYKPCRSVWTLLQTMNSSQNKRHEIWSVHISNLVLTAVQNTLLFWELFMVCKCSYEPLVLRAVHGL